MLLRPESFVWRTCSILFYALLPSYIIFHYIFLHSHSHWFTLLLMHYQSSRFPRTVDMNKSCRSAFTQGRFFSDLLKNRIINLPAWSILHLHPSGLTCEWWKAMAFDPHCCQGKESARHDCGTDEGRDHGWFQLTSAVIAELFTPLALFQGNQQLVHLEEEVLVCRWPLGNVSFYISFPLDSTTNRWTLGINKHTKWQEVWCSLAEHQHADDWWGTGRNTRG